MIAPAKQADYLLIRDAARAAGLGAWVLRRQVKAGLIPKEYLLLSGDVRPVVRIHRAWLDRFSSPKPALACEMTMAWGAP